MKELGQKNLFYSLLLAAVMMLLLVGYFIWMLPSLYVSYTEEQNLQAVKKQHQAYVETGTYAHVNVKNPTASVSVKIPFEELCLELTSKLVSVKIIPENEQLQELAKEIQKFIQNGHIEKLLQQANSNQETEAKAAKIRPADWQLREKIDRWQLKILEILKNEAQLPVHIEVLHEKGLEGFYGEESFRIHAGPGQAVVLEAAVSDGNNQYTNYLAVEKVTDGIVFTVLPVITPQMEEIRPIVMQSVPMLCAVILMLVLIFSQLYSNGIVRPVYKKLQDINQELQEENKRQEMFLRASSHQLKTPVTAALLLIDGMTGQIGKYSDTRTYLPKVKEQLLSMRTMVEEILSLSQNRSKCTCSSIPLYELVQAQLASYRVAAADKQLTVTVEGDRNASIWADPDILSKIIDNLLSNAVAYTPYGKRISVILSDQRLVIQNEGAAISRDILPHIFEPFVCGEDAHGAHGLGLYIAAYYAKMTDAVLNIRNQENCVEAVLEIQSRSRNQSIF